jgi:CRISPR-associated protein Cas1
MATLYLDRKDVHVRLDGNALAVYAQGERQGMIPLNPLTHVVIVGHVLLETPVLHRLADQGASVVFLSGKRMSFRGMLHGRLHRNGALRVRQYEKSLSDFAREVAQELVTRKIRRQRDFLEEARERRSDLRLSLTTAFQVLEGVLDTCGKESMERSRLMGIEGGASAAYFGAYTGLFPESLNFQKRNRRPPKDPVNALLSLCYTLLHYEMVREIEVIGLDPVIGFLHGFDYGRESLACDLVEPYRSDVDRFVWELCRERTFTARDFAEDDEKPGCYLKKEARKRFYPAYEVWAKAMRPIWTAETRTLARRILDGQDPIPE